jgi:Flp pilus assembly protein TadG
MSRSRGQSLVELGLCLPVLLLLALGAAAVEQVADASSGLDAAVRAAAATAARAPDQDTAASAAQARFRAVIAAYPVRSPSLTLRFGGFERGGLVAAGASGYVDLGWEALAFLPSRLPIQASSVTRLELWRTRRSSS